MARRPLQRLHHRHPAQRVLPDVEHDRVPVGRDDRRARSASGTGRGSTPASVAGGVVVARATSSSSVSRSISSRAKSDFAGRRSWYCRSRPASRGSSQSQPVALAVGLDELELGDPVELRRQRRRVALEALRAPPPSGRALGGRPPRSRAPRGPARRRTCGRGRTAPTAARAPVERLARGELDAWSAASCRARRRASPPPGRASVEVAAGVEVVLDHRQHERGDADLQEASRPRPGSRRR